MTHQTVDWCFRNREAGGITVAQAPNLTLCVVIAAGILHWIWPSGTPGTILTLLFRGGLMVWAMDEIIRGVNPWRRFLGAAALFYEILTILT